MKSVDNSVTQLTISVNGVRVFCRGGNWGWDELLRRVLPDRLSRTVAMHRDMNFTMIRNWIGSSQREELYALCDENGILVWNDFWEAGEFLDDRANYVAVATDTIRRFRVHPSIVVWCGVNEETPPTDLNAALANAVATEDPEIFYQPNSAGDPVSGHGPYHWIEPARYYDRSTYDTNAFGFHTETAISDRLGDSNGLADFCAKAQFVNYESMRAIFEAWNSNLRQTYDYSLDVNGAYYGARKGCEPVHVQANPSTWRVLAANHTTRQVSGATVEATLYDLAGRQLGHTSQSAVTIAPSDTATAVLSQNTYWRYGTPRDMQALNSLAQTRLSLHVSDRGSGRLTATVANQGSTAAAMVRLALQDQFGERVLPTKYGDNYFWMLPGESRDIVVKWPDGVRIEGGPQVVAEAYNAPARRAG